MQWRRISVIGLVKGSRGSDLCSLILGIDKDSPYGNFLKHSKLCSV